MKKYPIICITLIIVMMASFVYAAEKSSDKMILEWTPEKIWLNKNELIMEGEFTNKRRDLSITRLDEFVTVITFTGNDGSSYEFIGKPKKMPLLKIDGTGSKKVTFNFGQFDGAVNKWETSEVYVFTHRDRVARK